ncbi:hydrolase [Aliivibrio kagoshimensis]|uniref:hydrolase n=1 Tax=Aliivibrio kagoshimensis TaxID=2910230 RepID=UPI003D0E76E8
MTPFSAMRGVTNPHLQTLLPRFIRRTPLFDAIHQRLHTPDGDFIDLAWTEEPSDAQNKPLFILFHGLEGSFESPYANGLLHAAKQQGWLGVMMHFRGCSGELNRHPHAYHSGETSDPRLFLQMIQQRFPENKKVAVGISLGGNVLTRYLAQYHSEPILDAAAVVSAPLDLGACSERIQLGFSKVYQRYLLNSLKKSIHQKLTIMPDAFSFNKKEVSNIRSIYQFDDIITAPLNGFTDAEDYYQRCSGIHILDKITIPTLIVHAKDDPFMTQAVIPQQPLPTNITYCLTEHGGHVGFVAGTPTQPQFWLETALNEWFIQQL